ncbi:MAG: alpha/beta fold hydrolase [Pseudomonadota bacterium]
MMFSFLNRNSSKLAPTLPPELIMDSFNSNDATIRFCHSAKSKKIKILCLPGVMTFIERALPFWTALDHAGFEVYGFEYRDHGGSSKRHKEDPLKIDVDNFSVYLDDLHHFKNTYLKDEPILLLGSSFGGHLALRYLQDYDQGSVQHAVLVAPMVDLLCPIDFLPRCCLPAAIKLLTLFQSKHDVVPGLAEKTPENIIENEENMALRSMLALHQDKIMTRVSLGWIDAALESIAQLNQMSINIPVTVFLGKQEKVVDNKSTIKLLSEKAPKASFHFLDCSHRVIDHHLEDVVAEMSKLL